MSGRDARGPDMSGLLQRGAQGRIALDVLRRHVRALPGQEGDEARALGADHGEGMRRAGGNGDRLVFADQDTLVADPEVEGSVEDDDHLVDLLMEMQWRPGALFQDGHARAHGNALRLAREDIVAIARAPRDLLGLCVLDHRHDDLLHCGSTTLKSWPV